MLTQVHIHHFRLCEDVRIEGLGPVVALVGRNGAGKSNILQGISLAARIATTGETNILREVMGSPGRPFSVTLGFSLGSLGYEYGLSLGLSDIPGQRAPVMREMLRCGDGPKPQVLLQRDGGAVTIEERPEPLRIGEFSPSLPSLTALLPTTDDVALAIKPALSFLSTVRYYPLDEPGAPGAYGGPVSANEYAAWVAGYEASGNAGDSVLFRIVYMSLKREKDLGVLKSLLGQSGLGLIDDIVVSPVNAGRVTSSTGATQDNVYYFVRFIPSRGRDTPPMAVGADSLSLGTRRVLRMLVSLLFDHSSVMLLEQPEDSLHQGLTKSLIGLLRQNSGPAQLIMSSHSSVLLNRLGPEEVRLVSLHQGLTVARRLTPLELEIAADFMNQQGPLYDFLETVQED